MKDIRRRLPTQRYGRGLDRADTYSDIERLDGGRRGRSLVFPPKWRFVPLQIIERERSEVDRSAMFSANQIQSTSVCIIAAEPT